jgi:predicted RND superfamily exporter protein
MWGKIAGFILRNRILLGSILILLTAWMGWEARNVRMSYQFSGVLPHDDSTYLAYENFTKQFSEDGNVLVFGCNDPEIWELSNFNAWKELGEQMKKVTVPIECQEGGQTVTREMPIVDSIFSIAHAYEMYADTVVQRNEESEEMQMDTAYKFSFRKIVPFTPRNQSTVDSIHDKLHSLPFYEDLLYKSKSDATILMVFINPNIFNSKNRGDAVDRMVAIADQFKEKTYIPVYVSGLPFVRNTMMTKVKKELKFFTILSLVVSALSILVFFRSARAVLICTIIIGMGVVFSMGTIALFDYPITMLMGLIPPLMIVIGVPNCIYLLTKYHSEFVVHGNKMRAMARVVQKVGEAAFMINATTAVGFATFIFIDSEVLQQFGVISALNSMLMFFISLIAFPIMFSYTSAPGPRHLKHMDMDWLYKLLEGLLQIITKRRRMIYGIAIISTAVCVYGMTLIETTGNIVDDLPDHDRVITDLRWFEKHFNGVMPFEIMVESKKEGVITKPQVLSRISQLQDTLKTYPQISKSLSIADASKFARQAFYNGDPERYTLIQRNEQSFIAPFFQFNYGAKGSEKAFVDSTKSKTRISAHVADIGTKQMASLLKDLKPKVDSIFPSDKFKITFTGTCIVFLEGTNYLVDNLFSSMLFAIAVISIMMAWMFKSPRMVIVSLIPNIIPQIITAGLMGFFGIPLKPSTILVFSIAFGITVDNTIHFLAKYRQEIWLQKYSLYECVLLAVKDTGASILYTSIVLFFGFGMFAFSQFDGSRALGVLTALTLLSALLTNLIVLPAMLLSFNKSAVTEAFIEPEESEEINELDVKH